MSERFHQHSTYKTKSEANKVADKVRKGGRHARVRKLSYGYSVYIGQ